MHKQRRNQRGGPGGRVPSKKLAIPVKGSFVIHYTVYKSTLVFFLYLCTHTLPMFTCRTNNVSIEITSGQGLWKCEISTTTISITVNWSTCTRTFVIQRTPVCIPVRHRTFLQVTRTSKLYRLEMVILLFLGPARWYNFRPSPSLENYFRPVQARKYKSF